VAVAFIWSRAPARRSLVIIHLLGLVWLHRTTALGPGTGGGAAKHPIGVTVVTLCH
jgi:hypothetical protein